MSVVFFANEEDVARKVNIDDLYEKKKKQDMKQLAIFNKVLNRINRRIVAMGRSRSRDNYIWYLVPEYIIGETLYNKNDCIAYLVTKLTDNGFAVKYIHPNMMLISWENWIPQYVRQELKKKTGVLLDEHGNVVKRGQKEDDLDMDFDVGMPTNARETAEGQTTQEKGNGQGKQFRQISDYKPTGNLVYNKDYFEKIEKKVSFEK
jgi:hypothetical protein